MATAPHKIFPEKSWKTGRAQLARSAARVGPAWSGLPEMRREVWPDTAESTLSILIRN